MNTNNIEIPLLVVANILTMEFLTSSFGLALTGGLIVYTFIRIIQYIRNWNKDRNEEKRAIEKRKEEKRIAEIAEEEAKRAEEKHLLEMKLLEERLKKLDES